MAYDKTTKTVYATATEGVSFNDVQRALGTSERDLGSLCKHLNINKWARYKPIPILTSKAESTPAPINDSVRAHFNYGVDMSAEWNYNLHPDDFLHTLLQKFSAGQLTEDTDMVSKMPWPVSGASAFYRLSDFVKTIDGVPQPNIGYKHDASPANVSWTDDLGHTYTLNTLIEAGHRILEIEDGERYTLLFPNNHKLIYNWNGLLHHPDGYIDQGTISDPGLSISALDVIYSIPGAEGVSTVFSGLDASEDNRYLRRGVAILQKDPNGVSQNDQIYYKVASHEHAYNSDPIPRQLYLSLGYESNEDMYLKMGYTGQNTLNPDFLCGTGADRYVAKTFLFVEFFYFWPSSATEISQTYCIPIPGFVYNVTIKRLYPLDVFTMENDVKNHSLYWEIDSVDYSANEGTSVDFYIGNNLPSGISDIIYNLRSSYDILTAHVSDTKNGSPLSGTISIDLLSSGWSLEGDTWTLVDGDNLLAIILNVGIIGKGSAKEEELSGGGAVGYSYRQFRLRVNYDSSVWGDTRGKYIVISGSKSVNIDGSQINVTMKKSFQIPSAVS